MFNLEKTKTKFEESRGSYAISDRFTRPSWMKENDELFKLYANLDRLLEEGCVQLGCIVQANTMLFEYSFFKPVLHIDCPATIIYTSDQYYCDNHDELEELASNIFQLRDCDYMTKEEQELVDILNNEKQRAFNVEIPHSLTGGRDVKLTTIVVHRKHLEEKKLCQSIYPVLTIDCEQCEAMILPQRYYVE